MVCNYVKSAVPRRDGPPCVGFFDLVLSGTFGLSSSLVVLIPFLLAFTSRLPVTTGACDKRIEGKLRERYII